MKADRTARTPWVAPSLSVVSALLLVIAAQAITIKPATASPILWLSGPEANPDPSQKITSKAINLDDFPSITSITISMKELIELKLTTNTDHERIFNVEPGPITQQDAAIDLNQILLTDADVGASIAGPGRQIQNIATLELVANSLGSTTIAKGNRFSSGAGFPLSLAAISVVLLGTGLISLTLTVLRRRT